MKRYALLKKLLFFFIFFSYLFSLEIYAVDEIIRVAFEPKNPPFQFEEDGNAVGIHIDMLNKIAEKNNFHLIYIPYHSEDKCLDAVLNNRADVALGIKVNSLRNDDFYLSDVLTQSDICILASKQNSKTIQDISNINSLSVAIENNSINYSYLHNMTNLGYRVVGNQEEAFQLLITGKTDLLVGNRHSALYQLDREGLINKYIIINNYITPIEYTIVMRKGNEILLDKINASIKDLRIEGSYQTIFDEWISDRDLTIKNWIKPFLVPFYIAVGILLLILFNEYRLKKVLKKKVSLKTKELQEINKELKKQMLENRNYNELNDYIVKSYPSAIIVIDNQYQITQCNEKVKSFVKKQKNLIGENVMDIPIPSYILSQYGDKVFNENVTIINRELELSVDNDINKIYRYSIYQLFDIKKEIRGVVLSFEDITHEILFKEELFEKQKNKALNQIIAGIAHEIRNPLTSIKIAMEMIFSKNRALQAQDQMAVLLPAEIDRINSLINNLIDYAKPHAAQKERVILLELVEFCIDLILPALKNKRIKICMDVEENLAIHADRNQIEQVFINVILNAFESILEKIKRESPNQKNYNLKIRAYDNNDGYIYIQFFDEGIGMNEETVKRSTELFYTTKPNGKGIGLSFCKQAIEENGGKIMIKSELDKYTKVTIKLRRSNEEKGINHR
ncbi:MAG: transporter substrate-binding domain-containing protein [Firmicutes bacterium]|nr:transporter substrate-binding domain-containing protein [Bacillota bacterium]